MQHFRETNITAADKRRWAQYYLNEPWNVVQEFGDRNHASIEPCVRVLFEAAGIKREGVRCHQLSYLRSHDTVPAEDQVVSHYCRNPNQLLRTNCITASHMRLQSQGDNRHNAKCHNKIVPIANKEIARRRRQGLGPLIGPVFYPECPHGDEDGNGRCFINYGLNKNVNDSVRLYVLCD